MSKVELVRIRPTRGPWGNQVERLTDIPYAGQDAKSLLAEGRVRFPFIPRHELALVGYPEMPEWEVQSEFS